MQKQTKYWIYKGVFYYLWIQYFASYLVFPQADIISKNSFLSLSSAGL